MLPWRPDGFAKQLEAGLCVQKRGTRERISARWPATHLWAEVASEKLVEAPYVAVAGEQKSVVVTAT